MIQSSGKKEQPSDVPAPLRLSDDGEGLKEFSAASPFPDSPSITDLQQANPEMFAETDDPNSVEAITAALIQARVEEKLATNRFIAECRAAVVQMIENSEPYQRLQQHHNIIYSEELHEILRQLWASLNLTQQKVVGKQEEEVEVEAWEDRPVETREEVRLLIFFKRTRQHTKIERVKVPKIELRSSPIYKEVPIPCPELSCISASQLNQDILDFVTRCFSENEIAALEHLSKREVRSALKTSAEELTEDYIESYRLQRYISTNNEFRFDLTSADKDIPTSSYGHLTSVNVYSIHPRGSRDYSYVSDLEEQEERISCLKIDSSFYLKVGFLEGEDSSSRPFITLRHSWRQRPLKESYFGQEYTQHEFNTFEELMSFLINWTADNQLSF